MLIVGAHILPNHEFSEISFRVPASQIWRSKKIIQHVVEKDTSTGLDFHSFRIYSMEKEITHIPSINSILEWGLGWNSKTNPFLSINVDIEAWITIKPAKPQSIDWFFEQEKKLTTMLSFLAGYSMPSDCIETFVGERKNKVSILPLRHNTQFCKYKNIGDFFMPCSSLSIEFEQVLTNWFEIFSRIEMPSQLALSVLSSEELWLHVEFLSLVQVLEGFHRCLYEGNYLPDDEYEPIKKAILDALPSTLSSDHKDSLRSRIRYGNQVSLQKRLNELVDSLSEPLRLTILGDTRTIPRSWIDTRNYFTHWDEELRKNILEEQQMYDANIRMKSLIRVLFLSTMGIPHEAIINSAKGSSRIAQELFQLNSPN